MCDLYNKPYANATSTVVKPPEIPGEGRHQNKSDLQFMPVGPL